MGVQFILGRAGSGKSQAIMDKILEQLAHNPKEKIVVLVPEQATFNYEYGLSTHESLHGGILSVQILSFQRLAWMILQEQGGVARQVVNDLSKRMILRKNIMKLDSELDILKGAIDRPGYLETIAETLSEFKQYRFPPQQLQDLSQQQQEEQGLLQRKLNELVVVYNTYSDSLEGHLMDSDDVLNLLAEKIPHSPWLAQCHLYLDEFNGFTPQEMVIIGELMGKAKGVTLALTMNIGPLVSYYEQQVFSGVKHTYDQLLHVARQKRLMVQPPMILETNYRHQQATELAYLEQFYFTVNPQPFSEPLFADQAHLHVVQGQNLQAEIDFVAREIVALCRKHHYQYHDIGVFARDFATYDLLLETTLSDYEIPYFLDSKQPIIQHPLTVLLSAVIDVLQSNWSYQAVFRYLKTDLVPIPREQIDKLENYVLAYGIRGSRWYHPSPWQFAKGNDFDQDGQNQQQTLLEEINGIREQVVKPLAWLQQQLKQPQTAAMFVRHFFSFCEQLQIPVTLKSWCDEAIALEELTLAQIHHQIWNSVMDLLDQITEIAADEIMTLDEFAILLETGLEQMKLGVIPSSLDQVFIGSLQRSRTSHLKVVFLIGLNEGVFPAKPVSEGLFSDTEKALLKEWGINLAPTVKERLQDEQFLIYSALTRASDHLYCSYAIGDSQGKGLKPSEIIHKIQALFPQLNEKTMAWPPQITMENIWDYVINEDKSRAFLGTHLINSTDDEQDFWCEVYNWHLHQQHDSRLDLVIKSLTHYPEPHKLSADLVKALYGSTLKLSVSSIEKYGQCPYAHFLSYGLRLNPRGIYKLESLDVGQFYHKAIERFTQYLFEHQLQWQDLNAQRVKTITSEIIEQIAPGLQNEILLSTGRYQYIKGKLAKTVERCALTMMTHAQNGYFETAGVEVLFGEQGNMPTIQLSLEDGTQMQLIGRIDRIEQACANGCCYLRVIDFKTGTKGLSLLEIFYGLKIQLLTYLEVVLAYYQQQNMTQQVLPAGVLYYFFKNPVINSLRPLSHEEIEQQIMAEMMPKGLVTADLKALQLADSQLTIGKNTLLPLTLKKNAAPYLSGEKSMDDIDDMMDLFDSRSVSVVSHEQLALLRQHVLSIIKASGEAMITGDIPARPCKLKNFEGCSYCDYDAVCQFDISLPGHGFNVLPEMDQETLWQQLKMQRNREEAAHGKDMD